jgi:hypothetical protein
MQQAKRTWRSASRPLAASSPSRKVLQSQSNLSLTELPLAREPVVVGEHRAFSLSESGAQALWWKRSSEPIRCGVLEAQLGKLCARPNGRCRLLAEFRVLRSKMGFSSSASGIRPRCLHCHCGLIG